MKKIPIFSVGEYNGQKFTKEDMQKIVQNFKEYYPKIQPVVKLHHSEEQLFLQILAKKYGFDVKRLKDIKGERLIGLGAVKNLEFDEKSQTLYAEIDEIPQEFSEFVNKTPTRRISPEFYVSDKGFVLRAVALVDIPANKNMPKIVFDENIKCKYINANKIKEEAKMDKEILKLEKEKMELEKKLEKAEKKINDLDAKIKKYEEDLKAKDKEILKFKEDVKMMKIEAEVDKLITNGNLAKENKDLAIKALKLNFSEDGENPILELLGSLKVVDTQVYSEKEEEEEVEAKKKKEENDNEEMALLKKYEELVASGVDPETATERVYGKLLK